jgi:hypothetical protein
VNERGWLSIGHSLCSYPLLRGQSRIARTIAQTMPQPIHVMFGWAACHSRIFLWMAISECPSQPRHNATGLSSARYWFHTWESISA